MKKNLKFIAMAATVLLCACAKTEETATTVTTAENPKVKIATVTTEAVAQLEEYPTTVEAKVKNSIFRVEPKDRNNKISFFLCNFNVIQKIGIGLEVK